MRNTFRFDIRACLLAATFALGTAVAQAQTFSVLHTFTGQADGAFPHGTPILDAAGNLYGTTTFDGVLPNGGRAKGVVFVLDSAGNETVLYSFDGESGAYPYGALLRGSDGTLYGTTEAGSDYNDGNVFSLTESGLYHPLHDFNGKSDGSHSQASLVRDSVGDLYGVTAEGPKDKCLGGAGCGTVFKLNSSGAERVLHVFTGSPDGEWPNGGLVADAHGNLYGTAVFGGNEHCVNGYVGCGIVFRVDTTGNESILYSFTSGADGSEPSGPLVADESGNLYGTTFSGGDLTCAVRNGCGTVFKLGPTGTLTVLHIFEGETADGSNPIAGVIRDSAGNLYGTTKYGGAYGKGTVYEIDAAGTETLVYTFTGGSDGGNPYAGVIEDSLGNLYGATIAGGDLTCGKGGGCGVIFKLTP